MHIKIHVNKALAVLVISILACTKATPENSRITIALQPFRGFDTRLIEPLQSGIESVYGNVNITVLPQEDLPSMAYYKPRNRYRAEKLCAYLDSIVDRSHTKILGLTSKDISTTKGEYIDWGIFGLGKINGRPCVVSTFRLKRGKQGERLLTKRLVNVANHELGHTFGLWHCPNTGCLMEDYKGSIKPVDNSLGKFCEKCRRRLDIVLK